MKLYYYDNWGEEIIGELDLDTLTDKEQLLLDNVIEFLEEQALLDGKYKNLIVAESYEKREIINEDGPTGEMELVFD